VRSSLVPDFQLKWSGWTAFRSIFDASLTESISDLPLDSTHWWGPNTNFFASHLGKNAYTVVGGIQIDPEDPNASFKDAEWDQEASIKLLRDKYKNWNPVVKALTDITPNIRFYPNLSCSRTLDTWVFGDRTTLIGDAAHAHGGAHATGGSLAIDDAYALYLSLLSIFPLDSTIKPSGPQIRRALELYQAARKPHADRLLNVVYAANQAKAEKIRSGILETDEELRNRAGKGSNTAWLHEHDVVKTFEQTLRSRQSLPESSPEISAKL
jgi:salicylate hydroxylase